MPNTKIKPKGFSKGVLKSMERASMSAVKRSFKPRATYTPKEKDMVLDSPKKAKVDMQGISKIFKGEHLDRIKKLVSRSGITNFGHTIQRMSIANLNGISAMPSMGDSFYASAKPGDSGIKASKNSDIEGSLNVNAAANVQMLQPFFHTPGNAQDAYNLPKSYIEQIRWSRLMFNLNPYIHAITILKAYYPYSKFKLSTPEAWVTEFYESVAFNKRFNLYRFALRMSLSMKKFGEAIVWGAKKQDGIWPQTGQPKWVWDYFILLEPELVEIEKNLVGDPEPRYYLRPNKDLEELVRKLEQRDPKVSHLQDQLSPMIMQKIKSRENIPLDASTVSAIQDLTDGSANRGTPPYQCLFVNFIFEDFVRLALMAQANRYHFPIELWTIGNLEKNIMPSSEDLIAVRDMVAQAIQTPPFAVFFPPILEYKALGVEGNLSSIKENMEYAHRQFLIGMGVTENMLMGEALALDTPIPTPDGWTTMGDLKVGDKIFAKDGSITTVMALSPIWKDRPTYSVKVAGASPILADENHKWLVGRVKSITSEGKVINSHIESVIKTSDLASDLYIRSRKDSKYHVPVASPLDLPPISMEIPPYTLGAWLGDGTSNAKGVFSCHPKDSEIIDNIRNDGFEVTHSGNEIVWYIKGFYNKMKSAGFVNNKFIPTSYLRASFKQRLSLMQGLMDTDGSARKHRGECTFVNTNYGLMESIRELALSLGFKPGSISIMHEKSEHKLTAYSLDFTVGNGQPIPFRLKRKVDRCLISDKSSPHKDFRGVRPTRRAVESIDLVESVPTKCIQVAHPTGTFLAGKDFVVTHNSGVFSSNDTAGNQSFIRMAMKDRDEIEEWMRWHFFEPLARWNNLVINKSGVLVPIIPNIEWDKVLDQKFEDDKRNRMKYGWEKGLIGSERFIVSYMGENPEDSKTSLNKELGGVFDDGKRFGSPAYRDKFKNGLTEDKDNTENKSPEGPTKENPIETPGSEETTSEGAGGQTVETPKEAKPEAEAPKEETPAGVETKTEGIL
jgi:hypothetical protein